MVSVYMCLCKDGPRPRGCGPNKQHHVECEKKMAGLVKAGQDAPWSCDLWMGHVAWSSCSFLLFFFCMCYCKVCPLLGIKRLAL